MRIAEDGSPFPFSDEYNKVNQGKSLAGRGGGSCFSRTEDRGGGRRSVRPPHPQGSVLKRTFLLPDQHPHPTPAKALQGNRCSINV